MRLPTTMLARLAKAVSGMPKSTRPSSGDDLTLDPQTNKKEDNNTHMNFNFLNLLAALVQTEQSALAIPVVAMSPAGRIIGLALIGEELAGAFVQALHAQNAANASSPAQPVKP